jgi:iron complex outermembrane receptor protein
MKVVIFSIFILLTGLTQAQEFTISGEVTNGQKPVTNALIYAKGEPYNTKSAENGNYRLNLPKGKYVIVFAFGNRKEIEIDLDHHLELNVDLADAPETLDEVLVQSIRVDADSPITHSNLESEEIQKRNLGQDIPILMSYEPAVVSTSDAGNGVGYTSIRVRGSDATRVNVTLNGIPYNDQESQGTFWVNLQDFSSSVDKIQLQRGVGTSTNGSGAFGASMNISTRAVQDSAQASISNSYGSFNTRKHNVQFSTGLLNDHFEVAGRLSNIQSDGYVDRATSDLKSYFLHGAYKDENTLIKALVFGGKEITYQSWFGIDKETLRDDRTFNPAGQFTDENSNTRFYDNEVDNYSQDHYQLHWNQRYDKHWSSSLSLNYTYGRGYFEQFVEDADLDFHEIGPVDVGDQNIENADLIRRRWLDNDYYVIKGDVNYQNDQLDVKAGVFFSRYDGDHFGEVIWSEFAGNSEIRDRYYDGNGVKDEFTSYLKATWRIDDQWSVYGDLQERYVSYESTGLSDQKLPFNVDESYTFFNPKAGLTYQTSANHQLYFSYGRANREPRRQDFQIGITTAEQLDDFELGWRYQTTSSVINANLYYMKYQDQLVLTGALDDVGNPIRETSGKSYRLGLEVDGNFQVTDWLNIMPNVAMSRNKNRDFVAQIDGELRELGDTNISFSPEIIAGNQLNFLLTDEFQINLLSKYVGEQYMSNIDSEASLLDDFFYSDLNLVYQIKDIRFFDTIRFNALINNVFDAEYASNGYFFTFDTQENGMTQTVENARFYPQAGINFLTGVTLGF